MHWKKMVAPIIVTVFLGVYLLTYAFMLVTTIPELWIKMAGGIIPLGLFGVSVYVLYERIHEIRSGDEDDLSKY